MASKLCSYNRVIRKVRQHSTRTLSLVIHRLRLKNNLQKSTLAFKGGGGAETQKTINFGGKLSFSLSFLFPKRLHCCYILTAPTCTSTIISLEPCALNAEF
jgi:hypothetical protein